MDTRKALGADLDRGVRMSLDKGSRRSRRTSAGRRPRRERPSISRGRFATAQRNMLSAHRAQTSSPSRVGGVRTTNSSGANLLRGDRSERPRFLPAPCGAIWQTQTLVEPSAPSEFGLILERRTTKGTALVDLTRRRTVALHALTPPPRGADILIVVHHASTTSLSSPRSSLSTAEHSNRTKTETGEAQHPRFRIRQAEPRTCLAIICWHEENRIDRKELFVQTDLKRDLPHPPIALHTSNKNLERRGWASLLRTCCSPQASKSSPVTLSHIGAIGSTRSSSLCSTARRSSRPLVRTGPTGQGIGLQRSTCALAPRPGSGSAPTDCPDSLA